MAKSPPRIGFLCGSLREGSINQALSKALQKRVKARGVKTGEINLATYNLPLYHGDLKPPTGVKKLITRMKSFDGIIIVSPEYNGGLPPVLKNAIDWTSTVEMGHICGMADQAFDAKGHLTSALTASLADKMIDQMLARIKSKR